LRGIARLSKVRGNEDTTMRIRLALTLFLSSPFALGLSACDVDSDDDSTDRDLALPAEPAMTSDIGDVLILDEEMTDLQVAEADPNSCKWHCLPCQGGGNCEQVCFEIGNCDDLCGFQVICAPGWNFDEKSCGCTADHGKPCGDISCPGDTECCNESCGICVEDGGACTQQFCG
jgi:hypothetical protein